MRGDRMTLGAPRTNAVDLLVGIQQVAARVHKVEGGALVDGGEVIRAADPDTPPATPAAFIATAAVYSVFLSWAASDLAFPAYELYEGSTSSFAPGAPVWSGSDPSAVVKHAAGSGPWYYKLRVLNSRGLASGYASAGPVTCGQVTTNDIVSLALAKLGSGTLPSGIVYAGTVGTSQLIASGALIGTALIADASITSAKVVSLAAEKIAAGTISAAVSMTSPIIRYGKSAFTDTANAGFWLGNDSSVGKLFLGDAGDTTHLKWDGESLDIKGGSISGTVVRASGGFSVTDGPFDEPWLTIGVGEITMLSPDAELPAVLSLNVPTALPPGVLLQAPHDGADSPASIMLDSLGSITVDGTATFTGNKTYMNMTHYNSGTYGCDVYFDESLKQLKCRYNGTVYVIHGF